MSVNDQVTVTRGMRVISPEDWGPDLGLIQDGTWQEIVGPRIGAQCRGMYNLQFAEGGTTSLLLHPAEAVYYVVDGPVRVIGGSAGEIADEIVDEGGMVHVRPHVPYRFEASEGARLIGGPSPTDVTLVSGDPSQAEYHDGWPGITCYHRDRPGLMVPFISQDARLVVWLGAGAVTANMNYVVLEPGERNREHVHAYSEDTIHIIEGRGTAENVSTGESFQFGPGDSIHIEIGVWHAVAADLGERVVSVGGPCPADTDMLRNAGVDVDAITLPPGVGMPGPR